MADQAGVPREFFNAIYGGAFDRAADASDAPWDIGRAQVAVEALIADGGVRGRVLDLGCGTGDNAIAMAHAGASVLGVDIVPAAIEKARARAAARGVGLELLVADALELGALGRVFDVVLDSGTFHVFSDDDRIRYVGSVASVLAPGGVLHVLCFSDQQPPGPGPRHVSEAEIAATFEGPFEITRVVPTRFMTRGHPAGAPAWHATLARR